MERMLGKFSPQIYALLRIVAGFLFACHGAQKLFGVLGGFGGEPGNTAALFSMMGLAGVIEFGGGVFIMLGFLHRLGGFLSAVVRWLLLISWPTRATPFFRYKTGVNYQCFMPSCSFS